MINNLRYADDTVLIATSVSDLQQLVDRVRLASQKLGLIINTAKTKIMVSARANVVASIIVNGQTARCSKTQNDRFPLKSQFS